MKATGVYTLTDAKTGKFYVGSSQDMRKRITRHVFDLRRNEHHNAGLQELWNKNGNLIEAFYPTTNREEAFDLEQDFIDRFKDTPLLLNIGSSVRGGDNLSRNPNRTEIIASIKNGVRKWVGGLTALEKKQLFGLPGELNGMWRKTHSREAREKISAAHVGNKYCLGLKLSDERKRAISEMAKQRTGEKNSFFGKKHSPETIAKLSAIMKERDTLPSNARGILINEVEYESVTEAARKLQVSPALIVYRLKKRDKYPEYSYKDERSTTSA